MKTSVYRYYDKHGLLLYVGITSRGPQRNREHNETKGWWSYVARQDVAHYSTRQEAERVEQELIRQNRPPFNVAHNTGWQQVREDYLINLHDEQAKEWDDAWDEGFYFAWQKMRVDFTYGRMLSSVVDGPVAPTTYDDWYGDLHPRWGDPVVA